MRNKVLSDGKMKKIQTTIQRLFTNVHTHPTPNTFVQKSSGLKLFIYTMHLNVNLMIQIAQFQAHFKRHGKNVNVTFRWQAIVLGEKVFGADVYNIEVEIALEWRLCHYSPLFFALVSSSRSKLSMDENSLFPRKLWCAWWEPFENVPFFCCHKIILTCAVHFYIFTQKFR